MKIKVESIVNAPVEQVWDCYVGEDHITKWNFASDEWCCPSAKNDLRVGGKMVWRMEAKDGSMGFDFEGTYTEVIDKEYLAYSMEDGRDVEVRFEENNGSTNVVVEFDAEDQNPAEMQKQGWQAILTNFKSYVEGFK